MLWKPFGKVVKLVENNSSTEDKKRYETSMVVQPIRYSCLPNIPQYYCQYVFHVKHKRSENWTIFGEHVAPLFEPITHVNSKKLFNLIQGDVIFALIFVT